MGLGAWDCQMCSFQSLCLCLCICLCLRICNCHCLYICVTLPSLNSSCHELSENVWVWGVGLSEVQLSISELSVMGGGWVVVDETNALHGRTWLGSDNNPIIMCNMPNVVPFLVTYFADFELWTEFHLNENLDVYLIDPF